MELYLMQHGPQLPKEEDPEESLSPGGEALVSTSAQAVRKMGLSFDVIVTSPKKRAKQTAALVAEAIGFPLSDVVETDQVKAMTPAEDTVRYLQRKRVPCRKRKQRTGFQRKALVGARLMPIRGVSDVDR